MTKNLISCFGTFQNLKKLLSVIFEASIFELAKTESFMLHGEKKVGFKNTFTWVFFGLEFKKNFFLPLSNLS